MFIHTAKVEPQRHIPIPISYETPNVQLSVPTKVRRLLYTALEIWNATEPRVYFFKGTPILFFMLGINFTFNMVMDIRW